MLPLGYIDNPLLLMGYVDHSLDDRFSRGQELSRWTLGYLSAGRTWVQTHHGRQFIQAPAVGLIPPHASYHVEWGGGHGPWTELYAIFDPPSDWSGLLAWPRGEHNLGLLDLCDSPVVEEVETVLTAAAETLHSARINRQLIAFNEIEKALLALDEINPLRGHAPLEERIEQALAFIADHYCEPLTVNLLAQQVFLSPSRFSHLFTAQLGMSPIQYLERYRLERAAEKLLTSDNSIELISTMVGFTNPCHFSTRFRRCYGQSPRRYRVNPK